MTKLTNEVEKWIKEVAPYVKPYILKGLSQAEAIEKGIDDYRNILEEMVAKETDRSKKAIEHLKTLTFVRSHLINLYEKS